MPRTPPPPPPGRALAGRNLAVAALIVVIAGVLAASALGTRGRAGDAAAGASPGDQIAVGQRVYARSCAACHGANLEGQANWRTPLPNGTMPAPPHDVTGHTWHHPDQYLFEITKYGGQRFSTPDYRNTMPGFEGQLSDAEIHAVLAYIKSTWPPDIREAQAQQNR